MHHLYILKSSVRDWHYIGIAEDVDARLKKHNSGSVRSTKAYRPLRVVHIEVFRDKTSARKRELFLKKTSRARKELFERIDNGPIV
ncbi:MAG TPA: GIY-YIG nuclease family protein [Candidatus Paceibacterota bacterium]